MMHIYQREVDPGANDSLAKIVSLISPGSRVLDVGTGTGALGRYLTQHGCVVDGLTYSSEEAALARPSYARLEVMNLESTLPSSCFIAGSYDFIVCADILEHLRNAEAVLSDAATLLAPAGKLILSIPNPTHMGVVFGLLNGHFARTTEGLLDETHVQFLDRQGLEALVRRTGYRINRCDDVRKGLLDTEFALLDTLGVPATVRSYVSTLPDSDTYQFVWVLEPSAQEEIQTAALEIRKPLPPRFAAQLFVDYGAGFDEAKSCFAWGEMNEAVQTLVFSNLCLSGASRLRLDFCDRPGLFEFFSLQFFDPYGTCLGTWSGDWFSELTLNDCQWTASAGERGGRLVRALSNDPWIQMPVMAEVWQHAIRAELKMSAPVKYLDIAFGLAHQHLLKLENTCMQQAHALEHLQIQIDAMQAQLVSTQAQLATTEIAKEQAEKWAYQRLSELAQLHSQLDTIRNSNAYRLLETLRLAPQKKDSNV